MRIPILFGFLFFCLSITAVYSQSVGKFPIYVPKNMDQMVKQKKIQQKKDSIISLNKSIEDFQKNPTFPKLSDLSNKMQSHFFLKKDSQVVQNNRILDSAIGSKKIDLDTIKLSKIDTNAATASDADTVGKDDDAEPSEGCDNLNKIHEMIVEKQPSGSYLFSIVDMDGNPLTSFEIQQFNEELFNKKTEDAVYDICNEALSADDSVKAAVIISQIKKDDLYKRSLEASLQVDNSQDVAGTLIIHKYVHVYKDLPKASPKRSDTASQKGSATPAHNDKKNASAGRPVYQQAEIISLNDPSNMLFKNVSYGIKNETRVYAEALENISSVNVSLVRDNDKSNLYRQSDESSNQLGLSAAMKKISEPLKTDTVFTIYSIQIQFQDGFIEGIQVRGKIEGIPDTLLFINILPIAFSTKRNFSDLYTTWLSERTVYKKFSLRLGDVISYIPTLALDNKDYSPENQVYTNKKIDKKETEVNLYKEQTSKILEIKVYSDVKGVNNDNPNGLIQFELSKKLNLLSKRHAGFMNLFNYGWMNYITPFFTMNKIEENQKRLVLIPIADASPANNSQIPLTFTSTINLFRRQNFNLGLDLTLSTVDIPAIKSTFNLGAFINYGNVPVQDTIREKKVVEDKTVFVPISDNNINNFDVNTSYWGGFLNWQIFPNPKYGLSATGRIFYFKTLTSKFRQVRDSTDYYNYIEGLNGNSDLYLDYKFKKMLGSIELYAFFKPSENNKVFFRYRLTQDLYNYRENFKQIQIGFASYLTTTKEAANSKKNNTVE